MENENVRPIELLKQGFDKLDKVNQKEQTQQEAKHKEQADGLTKDADAPQKTGLDFLKMYYRKVDNE